MAQAIQEQIHQQMATATGMGEDFDMEGGVPGGAGKPQHQAPFDLKRQPSASAEPGGFLGTQ